MTLSRAAAAAAAVMIVSAGVPSAEAASSTSVWVDEVESYGTADHEALRVALDEALRGAGFETAFAPPGAQACAAGDRACLSERARERGAKLAIRATYLVLAGEISIAVEVVSAESGRAARHVIRRGDLESSASEVAAWTLAMGADLAAPPRGSRTGAWTLAGTSATLAAAGGAAISYALWQRQRFFTEHVDGEGHVVGVSPAAAKSAERRARLWSWTGALALTGAAASGVTAGFLFSRAGQDGHQSGVAVQGSF